MRGQRAGAERVAKICVHPDNNIQAVSSARAAASRIFAEVGVRIEWHSKSSCRSSEFIQISFSEHTPEGLLAGALACSRPYEGTYVVVFYDRVKQTIQSTGAQQLLAFVMVHEITHILQGMDRHSASGIMKAQWSFGDYFDMGGTGLALRKQTSI